MTSLLVGLAIAGGAIQETDERLPPPVADVSGPKAAITVENLLTMTSGFAWDESTAVGYNTWMAAVFSVIVDGVLPAAE